MTPKLSIVPWPVRIGLNLYVGRISRIGVP